MSDFVIFIVGIVVTLIAGMGVITSTVFMGYRKSKMITQPSGELTPTI